MHTLILNRKGRDVEVVSPISETALRQNRFVWNLLETRLSELGELDVPVVQLRASDVLYAGWSVAPHLDDADFAYAALNKVCLWNANAPRAKFTKANLVEANLASANLSDADFSGADLSGANFAFSTMYGVNLSGAITNGINIDGARGISALWLGEWLPSAGRVFLVRGTASVPDMVYWNTFSGTVQQFRTHVNDACLIPMATSKFMRAAMSWVVPMIELMQQSSNVSSYYPNLG